MIGAIISFTTMAIAGRAAALDLDTFEIMLFRSITGLAIVLIVGWHTGQLTRIKATFLRKHFIRNICHFTGQNLWFFAITVVPLAQVFALEFTTPIWVLLLSPLLLSEKITRASIITALVGFMGVILVTQPGVATLNLGVAAAAGAAIAFALTAIFTRQLTQQVPLISILFYLTAMQCVFGLVAAGIDGDIAFPTSQTLHWVVIIGIAGLSAHFCLTTALSKAPASFVMPIDFARLPVIICVGYLLYDEAINIGTIVGAIAIFTANYVNIRGNRQ